MRVLIIMAILASFTTNAAADDLNDKTASCLSRIEREIPFGDTITVFTVDNTVIRGTTPAFMTGSSQMYIWSITNSGTPQRVMIPIADIDKVQYQKPSRGWKIVGLLAGAISGWYVGKELAPEDKDKSGFFDFSDIGYACLGVMVGGVTGAIIGNEFDKSITVTVTLKCR